VWQAHSSTKSYFQQATIDGMAQAVFQRWTGTQHSNGSDKTVALRCDNHIFAWVIDPYFTPEKVADDFMRACENVLKIHVPADNYSNSLSELESLILREGAWGSVIRQCQSDIELSAQEVRDSRTHVAKTIKKLQKTRDSAGIWQTRGDQFPNLSKVAVKILQVSPHSCSVERVCKVNYVYVCVRGCV
jgi:hypothetical protein